VLVDDDGTVRSALADPVATLLSEDLAAEAEAMLATTADAYRPPAGYDKTRYLFGQRVLVRPLTSGLATVLGSLLWWARRDSNPRHLPCKSSGPAAGAT
jgi:hypothetical protein